MQRNRRRGVAGDDQNLDATVDKHIRSL